MANIKILPYADQDAALQRQAKLAQLLQEQGSTPQEQQMVSGYVIPNSPLIGLSKMLETYMGKKKERDVTAKQAELKKQARSEADSWLERISNAQDPTLAYRETPIMENASDEDRTELQPKMVQQDTDEQRGDMVPAMQRTPFVKPGMSDKEMNIELMRAMSSGNPMLQNAAQMYASLRPKATSSADLFSKLDPSKMTDESRRKVLETGNPAYAEFKTTENQPSAQRYTKEFSDKAGNKYRQEYAFDPIAQAEKPIGQPYLADVYHAPQNQSNDIQNGARLREEYNSHPVIKQHSIISTAYGNLLNGDETGAGDMSLIFQYMKMLDPNSVVREGEYATAQNSGNVPQSVMNYYNKAISGERLQPEQRNAFISQAKKIYQTSAQQAEIVRQGIEKIGLETGVNPRLYPIPEPTKRESAGGQPSPNAAPAKASEPVKFEIKGVRKQ